MKKYLFVMLVVLSAAGCGQDGRNGSDGQNGSNGANGTNGTNAPTNASVLSNFTATDPASRIPTLNLSGLALNSVSDIVSVIDCVSLLNGQPDQSGASPAVNGVAKNQIGLSGSTTSGIIQFGPLSHASHATTDVCYTIGQEEYSYNISGNTLTLCDIKYASCATFTAN